MSNYFMKVDKDLFKLGLSPIEILIVAQVMEFNTNTGDCFISDKTLAENFSVSESTITRTLKGLETKGLISRNTKNAKGGKERHITVNTEVITKIIKDKEKEKEKDNTTSKMPLDESIQPSKRLLTTSKLTIDNKQNDLIKDKGIDKGKDNVCGLLPNGNKPGVACRGQAANSEPVAEVSAWQLRQMGVKYEIVGEDLVKIAGTGKIVRVKGY